MVKEYKRYLPIFNRKYSIFVYDNVQEFKDKFRHLDLNGIDDTDAGFFIDKRFVLYFDISLPLTNGIIAHECKHFVNELFNWIGQYLDTNNDEVECYILGYLVDEVHKIKELKP